MAHGFDKSRPDVGAIESRVTTETELRFDERGAPSAGTADPLYLEEIMDPEFWEVSPEVTRVAAVVQAFQSRLFAQAEVGVSDIRRQWYLKRSKELRRFADMLGVRAIDLSLEAYRNRLQDVFLANVEGGALKSYHRILGAYTGVPAFVTRTDQFPGYWIMGVSRLTGASILVPAIPQSGVQLTSASGETLPGIGTLTVDPGPPVQLSWQAPGDPVAGDPVEVLLSGRYFVRSYSKLYNVYASVDTTAFSASASASAASFSVHILPMPDICCDEQAWLPSAYSLTHGLVAETLGVSRISEVTRDEMIELLKRTADHPPVGIAQYPLEEPGLLNVEDTLGPIWCTPETVLFASAFPPQIPVFGDLQVRAYSSAFPAEGSAFSLYATGVDTTSVPDLCGPFIVIKERFHDYENAFAENFELGPTFHWRVQDNLVSSPEELTGLLITEISADTLSGVGVLNFDEPSGTLLWQAPDPSAPFGLDPLGSGAQITIEAPTVSAPFLITGVTVVSVLEDTPNGVGLLTYDPVAQTMTWQAPGDVSPGTPLAIPATPGGQLRLRSSTVTRELLIFIFTASLPGGILPLTDGLTVTNPHAGMLVVAASANTRPGDGTLSYTPASGGNPAKLSWLAPGETPPGAETDIEESGAHIVTANSGARLTIEVDLDFVPTLATSSLVTITAPVLITDGGDFQITSGNSLYRLRVRVLANQLPTATVLERLRVRTAELRTVPVLLAGLSATAVECSLLDRIYSENVGRQFAYRLGNSPDEDDPSYDPLGEDFTEIAPYDRLTLTNPYIQFRITIEDRPDHESNPTPADYEFLGIALRRSVQPIPPRCLIFDDFYRWVTLGFDAECNLITDMGMVLGGVDGFLTTVSSPRNIPEGFLVPGFEAFLPP